MGYNILNTSVSEDSRQGPTVEKNLAHSDTSQAEQVL